MNDAEWDYETRMVPALFRPWAVRLVEAADVRAGQHILDVACGTGVVARTVAARLGANATIAAIDRSPRMLAVAREVAGREQASVDWREARAEQLPFADRDFDRVLCQFALVYFDDRAKALAECARVLRPGGMLALSVWQSLDRHPFYRTLNDAIQRHAGKPALERAFALGDAAELRALIAGAGYAAVDIDSISLDARFPDPPSFLAGEIELELAAIPSMQRLEPAQRQAVVASISHDMRAALDEVARGDHVVLTSHAHLARACR
jgi:ubiquinone/menaquinone biosynthesis C-methylase UbiE